MREERACNCLRGQVNGHKATLYFTLSTTCLGIWPRLTNFADFLAFRALYSLFSRVPLLRVILVQGPEGLGPDRLGGSKQDAWIEIELLFALNAGTFLCLQQLTDSYVTSESNGLLGLFRCIRQTHGKTR